MNPVSFTLAELIFSESAVHDTWDESVNLGLGKHGIAANVLISMVPEAVSMDALNNFVILVDWDLQTLLLWLWLSWVLFLWDLREVVFPLQVSSFYLFFLKVTGKGRLEFFEQLKFHSLLDLRNYLPAENKKVIRCILAHFRLVRLAQIT